MENSEISWTHHTWNPWLGCTKVSDGCKFCYAETLMDHRYGKVKWGPQGTRVRTSEAYWKQPYKWNRKAKEQGTRFRVFCASLADVFEDREELIPWRADLLSMIVGTPHLDWLLLTKRPEGWSDRLHEIVRLTHDGADEIASAWLDGGYPPNIWMGTSVEDQKNADERIPHLIEIPARVRFLSCEPLLGPIDFRKVPGFNRFDLNLSGWWVIVGGESGSKARPMHPDWARQLRDQCVNAGVPFHFKQNGEYRLAQKGEQGAFYNYDGSPVSGPFAKYESTQVYLARVGKHAAGRILDGQIWDEFP